MLVWKPERKSPPGRRRPKPEDHTGMGRRETGVGMCGLDASGLV